MFGWLCSIDGPLQYALCQQGGSSPRSSSCCASSTTETHMRKCLCTYLWCISENFFSCVWRPHLSAGVFSCVCNVACWVDPCNEYYFAMSEQDHMQQSVSASWVHDPVPTLLHSYGQIIEQGLHVLWNTDFMHSVHQRTQSCSRVGVADHIQVHKGNIMGALPQTMFTCKTVDLQSDRVPQRVTWQHFLLVFISDSLRPRQISCSAVNLFRLCY